MEAGTQAAGATPGHRPLGVARRRWGEEIIRALLFLAAAISVLTTLGIVFALLEESVSFFQEVGLEFFAFDDWAPLFNPASFGIWQLLNGTFLITGIAILVAIPVGLGCGDLPLRVRVSPSAKDDQADARGARRRADRRFRLLRAHVHHPDDPE